MNLSNISGTVNELFKEKTRDKIVLEDIISNVNHDYLPKLHSICMNLNNESSFIEENKNLVILDRNPNCLNFIVDKIIAGYSLEDYQKTILDNPAYLPHHENSRMGLISEYLNNDPDSEIIKILSRVKGVDSAVEKFTRNQGNGKEIKFHDIDAVKFVLKNKLACYQAREILDSLDFFKQSEDDRDYYQNPKQSGYKAIHSTFRYAPIDYSTPELDGRLIEFHFVTEEDRSINKKKGLLNHDSRSHNSYNLRKLSLPHLMGNYQVIVFDHNTPIKELSNIENKCFNYQKIFFTDFINCDSSISYHHLSSA